MDLYEYRLEQQRRCNLQCAHEARIFGVFWRVAMTIIVAALLSQKTISIDFVTSFFDTELHIKLEDTQW